MQNVNNLPILKYSRFFNFGQVRKGLSINRESCSDNSYWFKQIIDNGIRPGGKYVKSLQKLYKWKMGCF